MKGEEANRWKADCTNQIIAANTADMSKRSKLKRRMLVNLFFNNVADHNIERQKYK
jgi:hypothetical protein